MGHLRPVNGSALCSVVRRQDQQKGEYCFVDYSSCTQSDVCWLADMDNSCDERDNCIVDIT